MNPLYSNIRGAVITDFYSAEDLKELGHSIEEFPIEKTGNVYEKACDLYTSAEIIEDKDLMSAASDLIRELQNAGYGLE